MSLSRLRLSDLNFMKILVHVYENKTWRSRGRAHVEEHLQITSEFHIPIIIFLMNCFLCNLFKCVKTLDVTNVLDGIVANAKVSLLELL